MGSPGFLEVSAANKRSQKAQLSEDVKSGLGKRMGPPGFEPGISSL